MVPITGDRRALIIRAWFTPNASLISTDAAPMYEGAFASGKTGDQHDDRSSSSKTTLQTANWVRR